MGIRTNQEETINVLNAHLNARCEDDNCETCQLRLTQFNENIDYCYALSLFSEMFFINNSLREGKGYAFNYDKEFREKFNKLFKMSS